MTNFWELHHNFNKKLKRLKFEAPVAYVYNPLEYASNSYEEYLKRYGKGKKKALFLGMNPGPFGMAQTGIPFGEVEIVKSWMKINKALGKLPRQHPKRPILGLACDRSEVSGRRLWGYFGDLYPNPKDFFKDFFVLNYCPLVFMEESGRNITPDKLPIEISIKLFDLCDNYLRSLIEVMQPEICVGVGAFAEQRLKRLGLNIRVDKILHPSPASPVANRGWAAQAQKQLSKLGLLNH